MSDVLKNNVRGVVIAASYNIDGDTKNCEEKIQRQVSKERKKGNKNLNHLILRNSDYPEDIKHTLPIFLGPNKKVHLLDFPLLDAYNANFHTIGVIGNNAVADAVDRFESFVAANNIIFVHEGKKISRINTLTKELSCFPFYKNENTLEISGDTPLCNSRQLALDSDNTIYDLILHINAREVAGEHFPRNYHWQLQEENGDKFHVKEPNAWIWDLEKLSKYKKWTEVVEKIYDSRKSFLSYISMPVQLLRLIAFDGAIPRLDNLNKIYALFNEEEKQEIKQYLGAIIPGRQKPTSKIAIRSEIAGDLANILWPGIKAKVKVATQPGLIIDIDSLEDVIFFQALMQAHPEVYPQYKQLEELASSYSHEKTGVNLFDNWIEITNSQFKRYGINAEYQSSGLIKQNLFSAEQIKAEANHLLSYQKRAA